MVDPDATGSERSHTTGPDEASMVGSSQPRRYRCTACGNLTRFDVTATRRTRSFHHYDVGGALEVEETEVLSEVFEEVSCRWCGNGSAVVEADGDGQSVPGADKAPSEAGE